MRYPQVSDAPASLLALDGHCGPLAAWLVLRYFRKRAASSRVIKACCHSPRGAFTVGLAVAFAEFGLAVTFHTRRDSHKQPLECRLYRRARQLGVSVLPAINIGELAATLRTGSAAVVFYQQPNGVGHFSPVADIRRGQIVLPTEIADRLSLGTFERAWRRPGFPQQCVIVRRRLNKPPQSTSGGS